MEKCVYFKFAQLRKDFFHYSVAQKFKSSRIKVLIHRSESNDENDIKEMLQCGIFELMSQGITFEVLVKQYNLSILTINDIIIIGLKMQLKVKLNTLMTAKLRWTEKVD